MPPLPSPPATLRRFASREDAAALEALCGVRFQVSDLPSLLDPRGIHFQRLEWAGDAILDALLVQHRHTRPRCCTRLPLEQLCSDEVLAAQADRLGLSQVLDWSPSPGRLADLVEALVGAAWRVAPVAAVQVAGALVHQGLTLGAVGGTTDAGCAGLRDDAHLGSAVLEAAASTALLTAQPDADEGQLSGIRHHQLSAASLIARGRSQGLLEDCSHDSEHLLDHVQAAVGRISATRGLLPAMQFASSVLAGPAA